MFKFKNKRFKMICLMLAVIMMALATNPVLAVDETNVDFIAAEGFVENPQELIDRAVSEINATYGTDFVFTVCPERVRDICEDEIAETIAALKALAVESVKERAQFDALVEELTAAAEQNSAKQASIQPIVPFSDLSYTSEQKCSVNPWAFGTGFKLKANITSGMNPEFVTSTITLTNGKANGTNPNPPAGFTKEVATTLNTVNASPSNRPPHTSWGYVFTITTKLTSTTGSMEQLRNGMVVFYADAP